LVTVRAVILAAGESRRMGTQKLFLPFRNKPMIEHVLEAAADMQPLIVTSADLAEFLDFYRPPVQTIVNDEPHRGMSHSLRLADATLPANEPFLVLLGDKPLVTRALIQEICAHAGEADLIFPQRGEEPGHPVFFSAKARRRIARLPEGDSLRTLRENPGLSTLALLIDDPGAYLDVDSPGALNVLHE
ncbi:MAG: nucleotidyltransferase family protein, partial [Candidatus Eremiobacteraeota bacterium]|nr:nucleotidyltransferase family protein [Candidatus Eremiobacteraeota bacterium]